MRRSLKLLLSVMAAVVLSALAVASACGSQATVTANGAVGTATPLADDDDDDGDVAGMPADPNGPVFSDPRNIDNAFLPITAFESCKSEGVSPDGDTRSK